MEPAATTPPETFDFGQLLVRSGLISEAALAECLEVQREVGRSGLDIIPRLGELLVARGFLTQSQVLAVLSQQEKSILFCPRCEVQVNVPSRPDVSEVRCIRCRGSLVQPRDLSDVKVSEDSIIFISREPVPREVEEAAKDPARRFGKYTLINEIGRGGAGVVHRAWDHYLSQFVALKRIHGGGTPGSPGRADAEGRVASLLKEARAAARLRHPNIVIVYEVGRVAREYYISMEYLEGSTLADHVRKAQTEGKVSPFYEQPRRYLHVFRDVGRALHYAHTRPAPIIHCDLKPSNIFVQRSGRATVLDFGLARTLRAREKDETGLVAGTPTYMAPEQASGHPEEIDPRTDVYGLGAVMYECLTGRPPFGGSLGQVLRNALTEPPRPPSEVLMEQGASALVSRIPEDLVGVTLTCLEKSRENRHGSAMDLVEALDQILRRDIPTPPGAFKAAGAPVSPAPETATPAARRGPWALAIVAAAALAVGGAVVRFVPGLRPESGVSSSADLRYEVDKAIARFRPDTAAEFCRSALAKSPGSPEAEELLTRALWVEGMRAKLISQLNAERPSRAELGLRDGAKLGPVEILKATADGLVVHGPGGAKDVGWDTLEPGQVSELAAGSRSVWGEAERFGLAVYAGTTDQRKLAKGLLRDLQGGALAIPAAREISRIGGLD
ncbi:MAG TPA: serine/threonine-protein kinase [Planctomycetota bacterium]|nr:serine/threonine-protein kinase [Planctomycetota bacterium]